MLVSVSLNGSFKYPINADNMFYAHIQNLIKHVFIIYHRPVP